MNKSTNYLILGLALILSGCTTQQQLDSRMEANIHHDVDGLRRFLDEGANANYAGVDGKSPSFLMMVIGRKDLAAAQLLVDRGADVNFEQPHDKRNSKGHRYNALALAVYDENIKAISFLVSHGAKLDGKYITERGEFFLIYLIKSKNIELAKQLILTKGNVNITDSNGNTPLHLSMYQNNTELANLLINYGANLTLPNRYGSLPVDMKLQQDIEKKLNQIASEIEQKRSKRKYTRKDYKWLFNQRNHDYLKSLPRHTLINAFMTQYLKKVSCRYTKNMSHCSNRSLLVLASVHSFPELEDELIDHLKKHGEIAITRQFLYYGSKKLNKAALDYVKTRKDFIWVPL